VALFALLTKLHNRREDFCQLLTCSWPNSVDPLPVQTKFYGQDQQYLHGEAKFG